jgi:Rieske 2Fe-2S family protein
LFYTDPDVYRADIETIWRRGWLFAGHSCEIPNPGDYFVYTVDQDSLVVIRGDDGEVRALYNTCRHRGSLICTEPAGHVGKLVCPYHQWAYARDGRLVGCGGIHDAPEKGELGLISAPARELAGLIYVSLNDEPEEFEPAVAAMAPHLAPHGLQDGKVAFQVEYEIAANWKLVWENNRECVHCPVGHPQYVKANYDVAPTNDPAFQARIDTRSAESAARWAAVGLEPTYRQGGLAFFPDGRWYRASRTPLMEGFVTESLDGQPVAPLMGRFQEYDMGTLRLSTLPNFWNHSSSDHGVSTRLTPAGPQLTKAQVTWIVHRDAVEGVDYQLDKLLPFWKLTSEQDWVLCENNQRGVNSRRYRSGPYSPEKEYNVERFVAWYASEMTRESQRP